jgi:large subunit ribosomal protein L35e
MLPVGNQSSSDYDKSHSHFIVSDRYSRRNGRCTGESHWRNGWECTRSTKRFQPYGRVMLGSETASATKCLVMEFYSSFLKFSRTHLRQRCEVILFCLVPVTELPLEMATLRMKDIKVKEKADLLKHLNECKQELSQLRVAQQVSGTPAKLGKIRVMRKSVARVLTVLNQKQRENTKALYKGKKWMPKSLRPKLTKARRQALKPNEVSRKTRRALRQQHKFPKRTFAVKI